MPKVDEQKNSKGGNPAQKAGASKGADAGKKDGQPFEEELGEQKAINIIEAKNLTKMFGKKTVFSDLSFTIEQFSKIGIVGNNGTGKSTLFNILAGLDHAFNGEICLNGHHVSIGAPKLHYMFGYIPQVVTLPPKILVSDYFKFYNDVSHRFIKDAFGVLVKLDPPKQEEFKTELNEDSDVKEVKFDDKSFLKSKEEFLEERRPKDEFLFDKLYEMFKMDEVKNEYCGNLSQGWARKVMITATMNLHTPIFLLDEPTTDLDEQSKGDFIRFLQDIKFRTIIFSSHNEQEVTSLVSNSINLNPKVEEKKELTEEEKLEQLEQQRLANLEKSKSTKGGKGRKKNDDFDDLN